MIKGAKSIAQYKILKWVDENFVEGSVTIEFWEDDRALICDLNGDQIIVEYDRDRGIIQIDI